MKNKTINFKDSIGKIAFVTQLDDNYEFPVMSYYYEIFGIMPSRYQIDSWTDVDSLIEMVNETKIKAEKLYVERYTYSNRIKNDELEFAVFDLKDYDQILVLISPDSYTEGSKDDKCKLFSELSIFIYYNPLMYDINEIKSIFSFLIKNPVEIEVKENKIKMIYSTPEGLNTKSFKIIPPIIDLKFNYEDNFDIDVHEYLLKELKSTTKGIAILHGIPGTGKSMYLRFLISILSSEGKSIIYIPPSMVDSLSNPEFLPILTENPNSILIIEDAENALHSRETGNIAVTNLLNLADGLLSDSLNMQIIATFNTKLENIDKAIMREGRLILNHEFKALSPEKSTILSKQIGKNKIYTTEKTLAEIYNEGKKKRKNTKNQIGF